MKRYFFKILTSFPLDIYPGVALLEHMVLLFLIFWGTSILFSIVTAPIYTFPQEYTMVPFSSHPRQHLLSLVFLIIAILTVMRWNLMVLICISLMISDAEHLFIPLLATCMSSSEKNVCSGPLPIFKLSYLLFCCWVIWVLYVIWISTLYQVYGLQIFSHILHWKGCPFNILIVSSAM